MSFVVDASVVLAWCFHDEWTSGTQDLLGSLLTGRAHAPVLLLHEVGNGLAMSVRRGRVQAEELARLLSFVEDLPWSFDAEPPWLPLKGSLELADRLTLTVYDAAYLELAQRRGLPLASLDARLRSAATAIGTAVLPS